MTETLLAADVTRLDAADPPAHFRARFHLRDGLIYLDGNSLGALPRATADRLAPVVPDAWGGGLIPSWLGALLSTAPARLAHNIAGLLGAPPGAVFPPPST